MSALQSLLKSESIVSFAPTIENFELKLYRQNVRANYFVLIISGCADVVVGKENMKLTTHSFSFFGVNAILGSLHF